ncbi:MAG: hypothetical protein KBD78_08815 [Oligoflexales bacterium]|nr:hypothetical protein [Oligoflexales bacterium]
MKKLFKIKSIIALLIVCLATISGCGSSDNPSNSTLQTVPASFCKNNSELIHSTCSATFGAASCKSVEQLIQECPARASAELRGFGTTGFLRKSGSILLVLAKKVVSKTGSYLISGIEIDKVALDFYCGSLSKRELRTKINSTFCQGRTFSPGRAGGGGAAGFN